MWAVLSIPAWICFARVVRAEISALEMPRWTRMRSLDMQICGKGGLVVRVEVYTYLSTVVHAAVDDSTCGFLNIGIVQDLCDCKDR